MKKFWLEHLSNVTLPRAAFTGGGHRIRNISSSTESTMFFFSEVDEIVSTLLNHIEKNKNILSRSKLGEINTNKNTEEK